MNAPDHHGGLYKVSGNLQQDSLTLIMHYGITRPCIWLFRGYGSEVLKWIWKKIEIMKEERDITLAHNPRAGRFL